MRKILCLTRRHLMLFLRSPLNLLLSFASIFVILGIYILFLRDFMIGVAEQQGVAQNFSAVFTDRFMIAGLLVVISTTTCFGMIQVVVQDTISGIKRDFLVSPASPFQIIMSYLGACALVSVFFSCTSALGSVLYFSLQSNCAPAFPILLRILATVACSSFLNALLLLCLTYPLKSMAAFATLTNLYGTLAGFLAGAYLPYCLYPDRLRDILYYFPPAQMTSVLRQLFTSEMAGDLSRGMPADFLLSLDFAFGIRLEQGGELVQQRAQWLLMSLSAVFLLALLWALHWEVPQKSRQKKRGRAWT